MVQRKRTSKPIEDRGLIKAGPIRSSSLDDGGKLQPASLPNGSGILDEDEKGSNDSLMKVQDISTYDPSKLSDEVLRDDFRIVLAWYTSWKENPESFIHSREQIATLLKLILEEAKRRGPEVITFDPESMKPDSRELFEEVASKVGLPAEQFKVQKQSPIGSTDGIFLYVALPAEVSGQLGELSAEFGKKAKDIETQETDHITVLWANPEVVQAADLDWAALRDEIQELIHHALPLKAQLQGWAYFDNCVHHGEKRTALVALVDVPGLEAIYVKTKWQLRQAGIDFEPTHSFVPHITIGYLPLGGRVEFELPVLDPAFTIPGVQLLSGDQSFVLKALEPSTNPDDLNTEELVQAHWDLHLMYRQAAHSKIPGFFIEDVVNLHVRIVDELFDRGIRHPAPPDDGLDDSSQTFEQNDEAQPDWTNPVQKQYQRTLHSGVNRGRRIQLSEVLSYFESFKLRKPYIYLVGGLANHGWTEGDIDILVKDTPDMPEEFKHALYFRLGRALPGELAERLQIHYDRFHGPFTNFVELFDLTFERVNPENEVKEMSEGGINQVPVEKILWGSPMGKTRFADRIVAEIPEHKVYVEPFAGSAAVLFAKEPSEVEAVSDLDPEIAFAFKFVKNITADQLDRLRRKKWVGDKEHFKKLIDAGVPEDNFDRFYRFAYLSCFSFNRMRNGTMPDRNVGAGSRFVERLEQLAPRLKKVRVRSSDYEKVIDEFDGPHTFFFLDPPYAGYNADLHSGVDHKNWDEERFAKVLRGIKGQFLCTYGTRGSADLFKGFTVRRWRHLSGVGTSRGGNGPRQSVTLIATNYDPAKATRFQAPGSPAGMKKNDEWLLELAAPQLKVGEFFSQPKPTRAAMPGQTQSIERLRDMFNERQDDWLPAYVQKKYDGARHQIHRDGGKVRIISEDGGDNTDRLPHIVEAVKKLKFDKLVLDAELEAWNGKQHFPREVMAAYLHSKGETDDGHIVANVFDILYADEDIHEKPLRERLWYLSKAGIEQSTVGVPKLGGLNLTPSFLARSPAEVEKLARKLRKVEGSEGIVSKQVESSYPLALVTHDAWVKFHNATLIQAVVLGRVALKGGGWTYRYGVLDPKQEAIEHLTVKERQVTPVGDSFNSVLDIGEGEGILIEAETVNLEEHPDGLSLTAWVPRVISEWSGKLDSVADVISRARANLVLREKVVTESGEVIYKARLEKEADPYLEIPPESGSYRFVAHQHWRGKGVHTDFRISLQPDKLLIGWTMNTQIAGSVKEPVTTLEEARRLVREEMGSYSKINWSTGEWAEREKAGANKPVRISILSERKAPEPYAWIDVEGKTKAPEEGGVPPVGGTRQYPGVFLIVDKGTVEYGAQKPWFHEYFVYGDAMNYRVIFRQLKLSGEDGEVTKAVLPPSDPEAGAMPGPQWLSIYPDDLTPYVFSPDAVAKDWMPPKGYSSLPRAVRTQIPEEYQFWKAHNPKKMRDELVQAVKEKKVQLDYSAPYKRRQVSKASLLDADFSLQRQVWRGPKQVRSGPTRIRWTIRLDVGRPDLLELVLQLSPIDNPSVASSVGKNSHKDAIDYEGEVKPGHYLNPTKDTPSQISIVDRGKASVMSESVDYIKIDFKGEQLKGLFQLQRNDGEWLWSEAQAAPTTKAVEEVAMPASEPDQYEVRFGMPIMKVEKEKHLVTGIVLEPDTVDAQGDTIDAEAIERAAHNFLAKYNRETQMGLLHRMFGEIGVELVESYLAPVELKMGGQKMSPGTWIMTARVRDDKLWQRVKDGDITGFSIGGVAAVV